MHVCDQGKRKLTSSSGIDDRTAAGRVVCGVLSLEVCLRHQGAS